MGPLLQGVRVLDFGRYIAGPYCAALLGDLGAEVIRVEKVRGSEDRFIAPVGPEGDGALFLQCNRGKLGFTLDPAHARGREVLRRLVATADVIVANMPPAALRAIGLDYETLVSVKSDIILTTASAYGASGPYAEKVGFDGIGQAMSGAMYLSGHANSPAKITVNYVDFTTALSGAFGTLAALMHRRETGQGQWVETSLLGSALTVANSALIEQAVTQKNRVGSGNRSQITGPADTFQTRDGFVLVQCVGAPVFARWVKLMGEPLLLSDPRFATDISRGDNGEELSLIMARWCAARTNAEALDDLERARIPAAPVHSPQETLDDPSVHAGNFLQPTPYPGIADDRPVARAPVRLSATSVAIRGRAPTLGEHTGRILAELGYGDDDVELLRALGVV